MSLDSQHRVLPDEDTIERAMREQHTARDAFLGSTAFRLRRVALASIEGASGVLIRRDEEGDYATVAVRTDSGTVIARKDLPDAGERFDMLLYDFDRDPLGDVYIEDAAEGLTVDGVAVELVFPVVSEVPDTPRELS